MKIYGRPPFDVPNRMTNLRTKEKTEPKSVLSFSDRMGTRKTLTEEKENTPTSILDEAREYRESIRASRQKASSTQNNLRRLKYQFNNISSKIIRSKTSASARQVAGQARREVIRLKNEGSKGNVDQDELQAALSHAKAMERIAKKKVRHLEAEELAKARIGFGKDYLDEYYLDEKNAVERYPYIGNIDSTNNNFSYDSSLDKKVYEIYGTEEFDIKELDINQLQQMMESFSEMDFDSVEFLENLSKIDEMDFMDEFGLGEINDELKVAEGDMNPSDLKTLKIKHRNKEMKEIVKADAEYLKAMFKHFEEIKSAGAYMGGNAIPTSQMASEPIPTINVIL